MVKGQNNPRIAGVLEEFPFIEPVSGDLADLSSLVKAVEVAAPDEVYNLGAVSFVAYSFTHAELTADFSGLGVLRMLDVAFAEVGIDDWSPCVRQDPKFLRPAEVELLIGDATKAKEVLGWEPEVSFDGLVSMMVTHDLEHEAAC